MGNSADCCSVGCETKGTALLLKQIEDDRPARRNPNSVRLSWDLSHDKAYNNRAQQQQSDLISLQSSTDMSMKTSSPRNQSTLYAKQMPTSFMIMNDRSGGSAARKSQSPRAAQGARFDADSVAQSLKVERSGRSIAITTRPGPITNKSTQNNLQSVETMQSAQQENPRVGTRSYSALIKKDDTLDMQVDTQQTHIIQEQSETAHSSILTSSGRPSAE